MESGFSYTLESHVPTTRTSTHDLDLLLSPKRRLKRLTPDTDKDDKYWEKRIRNNIAAKKSRESKRQFESIIRTKVAALTEENALLRKELSLLKKRCGLPDDVSVLTEADREECLRETRESERWIADINTDGKQNYTNTLNESLNNCPNSKDFISSGGTESSTDAESEQSVISPCGKQISPRTCSYSFINQINGQGNQASYGDDPRAILFAAQQNNQRYSFGVQDNVPADFSSKKRKLDCVDRKELIAEQLDKLAESHKGAIDLTDDCDSDIREKLKMLSEQVDKMQKLVG